jgi:hypothetical protein
MLLEFLELFFNKERDVAWGDFLKNYFSIKKGDVA